MKTFLCVLFLAFGPIIQKPSTVNVGSMVSDVLISAEDTEEFTEDPIAFVLKNFDLTKHPVFQNANDATSFEVTFKCSKGYLRGLYNSEGELVSSIQKFENISIPVEIMEEIYRDYKGWEVTNIKYNATGKGDSVDFARYTVKIQNGDKHKTITKKLRF